MNGPPTDDPYRWCVYCEADCYPDPEDQEHAPDCPTQTGIYVVTEQELAICPHCHKPTAEFDCAECRTSLHLGDRYMLRGEDGRVVVRPGRGDIGTVICVGCAASSELTD